MKAVNPCGLKRAALINDLSCFGKCSLSVSMPILSSYGSETVPLPTALLSTHTGGFTGYVVQDTTEAMRAFAAHWKQVGMQFDCIATGYCCSPEQIRLAAEFIRSFADGRTLVVVDPVLGDHGRLYSGFTDARRRRCSRASPAPARTRRFSTRSRSKTPFSPASAPRPASAILRGWTAASAWCCGPLSS